MQMVPAAAVFVNYFLRCLALVAMGLVGVCSGAVSCTVGLGVDGAGNWAPDAPWSLIGGVEEHVTQVRGPCPGDVVCLESATRLGAAAQVHGVRLAVPGARLELVAGNSAVWLHAAADPCPSDYYCRGGGGPCVEGSACFSQLHRVVCHCPPGRLGIHCQSNNTCYTAGSAVDTHEMHPAGDGSAAACNRTTSCNVQLTYIAAEPTVTSDRVCSVRKTGCPAGTRALAFESDLTNTTRHTYFDLPCVPCADLTFQPDNNTLDTACQPAAWCEPGQYAKKAPTATSDTECAECPDTRYQAVRNRASSCLVQDTGTCQAGTYRINSSSQEIRTLKSVCQSCPDGTFSSNENATACHPWTTCDSGYGERPDDSATFPNAMRNRTCKPCYNFNHWRSNETLDNTKPYQCRPWTACEAGYTTQASPTGTSDRVCVLAATDDGSSDALGFASVIIGIIVAPLSLIGGFIVLKHCLRKHYGFELTLCWHKKRKRAAAPSRPGANAGPDRILAIAMQPNPLYEHRDPPSTANASLRVPMSNNFMMPQYEDVDDGNDNAGYLSVGDQPDFEAPCVPLPQPPYMLPPPSVPATEGQEVGFSLT